MIHDHFDGSANCVECRGPCKQTGDERTITDLVRWIFEEAEMRKRTSFSVSMSDCLNKSGVDIQYFLNRARESRITNLPPLWKRVARVAP